MNKRLHVGLYSPAWPPGANANGVVTYVHLLRGELLRLGHRVSIFTGSRDVLESDGIFSVIETRLQARWSVIKTRLGLQPGHVYGYGHAIASTVLRRHAVEPLDVLEMEESFGWFAQVAARISVPIVVKLHGPAFLSLINVSAPTAEIEKRIELEGRGLEAARSIVAPSRSTLEATAARYALRHPAMVSIANPVQPVMDSMIWRFDPERADEILFIGRFDYRKGADAMIEAFAIVLLSRPTARLTFVGPDIGLPIGTGAAQKFREYVGHHCRAEVAARIRYLGRCSSDQVQELRLEASVIVAPTRWESFGYVVAESMNQGCPIVAFDVVGVNELITDGETGLLAPLNDVDALALHICRVLDDPALAERLGARARVAVTAICGADKVAAQMLSVYREVQDQPAACKSMHGAN